MSITEVITSLKVPQSHGHPQDFDINFSHIITVSPRVEIQTNFWKGAKCAGSVGHQMTKVLSILHFNINIILF